MSAPLRAARILRALLRLEWRGITRHPRRSFLVLALVAVPVAAIVGGATLARLTQPSPADYARQAMGQADLRIEGFGEWQELSDALAALPNGAYHQIGITGLEKVSVPGTRLRSKLVALHASALEPPAFEADGERGSRRDLTQPDLERGLADGIVRLVKGTAPNNPGEVALSPSLLEGLGRSVGEQVTLEYGGPRTITGVVVDPEDLTLPLTVRVPAQAEYPGRRFLLAALPSDSSLDPTAEALREQGLEVQTRQEAAVGDDAITAFIFALGIIGLFEAGLVISAAFGVSLRRRQVEIGLLGSVGATAPRLTQSLLIGAGLLATLGGLLGSMLGVAGVAILYPWLEAWTQRLTPPLEIVPGHVIGAILLGVVAALIAAVLPARSAARLPVRQALAGRRPTSRRSRPWLIAGLTMVFGGIILMLFATLENKILRATGVVFGPIISILGFGACSPWLLEWSTKRVAGLPLAWRLAVRDAGRFRERNAAVVTAVLASMAMSVTMAALVASLETTMDAFPAIYRDDQILIEGPGAGQAARDIEQRMSVLAAVPLDAAYRHGEPLRGRLDGRDPARRRGWVAVGDHDLLVAMAAEHGREAFDQGRLLALDIPSDVSEIDFTSWVSDGEIATPPIERLETQRTLREPVFLLSAASLAAHGLEVGPPPRGSLVPWLVRFQGPVTTARLDEARALAAQSVRTHIDASLMHSGRFRDFYYAVFLICALTGLIVVMTAVSLSAAESAADERVLHTVGASPQLLRGHQAARAGFLALLGSLLALPAGLLAAAAFFGVVNFPLDFVVPWRDLVVIGLGLPAFVYGGAWLTSRPKRAETQNTIASAG